LTICAEQERQEIEGATQQEEVTESYQLMQQQLKQSDDTKATSFLKLSPLQTTISQLLTTLSATLHL